jgi:hypothetical protein
MLAKKKKNLNPLPKIIIKIFKIQKRKVMTLRVPLQEQGASKARTSSSS